VDSNTRDIPELLIQGSVTIDACRTTCYANGYAYPLISSSLSFLLSPPFFLMKKRNAGLQDADQCWCGNSYGSQGQANDSDCNMQCTGDSNELCGAGYYLPPPPSSLRIPLLSRSSPSPSPPYGLYVSMN
jgi:hypothetical protein